MMSLVFVKPCHSAGTRQVHRIGGMLESHMYVPAVVLFDIIFVDVNILNVQCLCDNMF